MRKWWCRLCTWHHSELDFYSASSLKQQSAGRDVASLGTHYHDSEKNNFCSFSLIRMLNREATNTNLIVFGCTLPGLEPTTYGTRHDHLTITAFTSTYKIYIMSIFFKYISIAQYIYPGFYQKVFEDTKGVITIRIAKKKSQHNGQKKKYKRTNISLKIVLYHHDITNHCMTSCNVNKYVPYTMFRTFIFYTIYIWRKKLTLSFYICIVNLYSIP